MYRRYAIRSDAYEALDCGVSESSAQFSKGRERWRIGTRFFVFACRLLGSTESRGLVSSSPCGYQLAEPPLPQVHNLLRLRDTFEAVGGPLPGRPPPAWGCGVSVVEAPA